MRSLSIHEKARSKHYVTGKLKRKTIPWTRTKKHSRFIFRLNVAANRITQCKSTLSKRKVYYERLALTLISRNFLMDHDYNRKRGYICKYLIIKQVYGDCVRLLEVY